MRCLAAWTPLGLRPLPLPGPPPRALPLNLPGKDLHICIVMIQALKTDGVEVTTSVATSQGEILLDYTADQKMTERKILEFTRRGSLQQERHEIDVSQPCLKR